MGAMGGAWRHGGSCRVPAMPPECAGGHGRSHRAAPLALSGHGAAICRRGDHHAPWRGQAKLARNIGVANLTTGGLRELLSYATVLPAVLQAYTCVYPTVRW